MKLINFNDPKIMAYSGLIAMVPKAIITLILSIITTILINTPAAIALIFMVTYPLVGCMIDLILYILKDKLWNNTLVNIPKDLAISSSKLLKFAKYLPKMRLIRFLIVCPVFSVIIIEIVKFKFFLRTFNDVFNWLLLTIPFIVSMGCILLFVDDILLKVLKMKKPRLIINMVNDPQPFTSSLAEYDDLQRRTWYTDSTAPGSPAYRELNPGIMGSITWISNHISPWK